MTTQSYCTLSDDVLEQITRDGFAALPDLFRIVLNTAMEAERRQYLNADRYERTRERRGYANGFKPKTVQTRVGAITVDVPQTRDGGFYPSALERGQRSERALTLAFAEMYVQGVSTRKVSAIVEQLCGAELTAMQVSRASEQLDAVLEPWRNRSLGTYPYVSLDARYEKVRQDGAVRDAAVLIATGVDATGTRSVLGVSVAISEHEAHWRSFLQSLIARGLCGVQLVISDAHSGLGAARQAVFGGIPWQRCQCHLQQNAQAYVPRQSMQRQVAADMRAVLNAPTRASADAVLKALVQTYATSAPRLSAWLETAIPEGLTVFQFPASHQRMLRTTNSVERLNREIKRRTRVVGVFPNVAACVRLVSALLMETSEEWETGRTYLTMVND